MEDDLIQTGEGTFVNKKFLSDGGRKQAMDFGSITSDTLTPEIPLTLPEPKPSTIEDGITGAATALLEQTRLASKEQAELEAKAEEARMALNESQAKRLSLRERITGVQEGRAGIEQEYKIPEKTQRYTDITNQLEASQRAQVNEMRALDGRGLTDIQKASSAREINRRYAFEQADLALLQSAANRDLLTATTLADRRIELELAPLKEQLEFETEFYNENKEFFNKADQRAFENKIKESDRAYQEAKTTATTLQSTKLQLLQSAASQNAPSVILAAIQKARTPEEAVAAAGQYAGDILERQKKQLELEKLGIEISDARKKQIAEDAEEITPYQKERQTRILQSVSELRGKVNLQTVGVASLGRVFPGSIPRNFKTDLDTLKAAIAFGELTAMREASKTGGALGQVSNIELGLLESALGGLDQGQSPANFKKNLDKIEASIKRWQDAANKYSGPSTDVQVVNGVRYVKAADGLYYPE